MAGLPPPPCCALCRRQRWSGDEFTVPSPGPYQPQSRWLSVRLSSTTPMPLASQARSSKAKAIAAARDSSYTHAPKVPFTPPSVPGPTKARNASKKAPPKPLFNTNPSSYDRTDPFFAFNTLIKLLGSLPSRIGGCQYKFTPDEHKLSLHLLSIVEPFVGLTASRRSMTRQPTEILDSIIFYIPSKRDLLSLALSCHRMYDVIFPRHYGYRHIKCRVSSISVWNHLIIHRSLARNVRRLEILDERASSTEVEVVPPGILASDTDLESTDDELGLHDKQERYFVSALNKMTALASFSWSCNHSPISIDNVWPTLLKCQSLNEVVINDNLVFSSLATSIGSEGEARGKRKPAVLTDLTTISINSTPHTYGLSKSPSLHRISSILNSCPSLSSLSITYLLPRPSHLASLPNLGGPGPVLRPQADDLLLAGRWPKLKEVRLRNLKVSSVGGWESVVGFLGAHGGLEVVSLDLGITASGGGGGGTAAGGAGVGASSSTSAGPTANGAAQGSTRLILAPNTLPKLRELQANKELISSILSSPILAPRPLETLKGFRLSGHLPSDSEFLRNLGMNGRGLRRVELVGWNEMEDIRRLIDAVPGLTWLDIGRKSGSGGGASSNGSGTGSAAAIGTAPNPIEWSTILSSLPNLTTFHGIKFFYEVSPSASLPGVTALSTNISMADRSRIRKNDEVAKKLVWKCAKLRRVDYWEGEWERCGKVVVLVREEEKVRWEVRRVKV